MWGLLHRRINSRRPRPTTAEAVKQAAIEEWDALTVDDYEQMILSMPEKGHTIYSVARTDSNSLFYSFEIGEN